MSNARLSNVCEPASRTSHSARHASHVSQGSRHASLSNECKPASRVSHSASHAFSREQGCEPREPV